MTIRIIKGEKTKMAATPAPAPTPEPTTGMTWKRWLTGMANAVLSGVASGGTAQFIGIDLKHSLMIAGSSAFVSFCKWMAQHPLPGAES